MITVDWPARNIFVPQSFLVSQGGSVFTLDTNALRLALKDLEDDPAEGLAYPATHSNNSPVTLAGTTFARTFEIINGYTIEFEDGAYRVILQNSNNNILEVAVVNQVSLASTNSAGLIEGGGSGGSTDPNLVAKAVWDYDTSLPIAGGMGQFIMRFLRNIFSISASN